MVSLNELESMKLGEVIKEGERTITKVAQKNGKEVWSIGGWISRSPKQVISWLKWDVRQQAKHKR